MKNKSNRIITAVSAVLFISALLYIAAYFLYFEGIESRTYVMTYSLIYHYIAEPALYFSFSSLLTILFCRLYLKNTTKKTLRLPVITACVWILAVYIVATVVCFCVLGARIYSYFVFNFLSKTFFAPGALLAVGLYKGKN